jgi:hypothetical protein
MVTGSKFLCRAACRGWHRGARAARGAVAGAALHELVCSRARRSVCARLVDAAERRVSIRSTFVLSSPRSFPCERRFAVLHKYRRRQTLLRHIISFERCGLRQPVCAQLISVCHASAGGLARAVRRALSARGGAPCGAEPGDDASGRAGRRAVVAVWAGRPARRRAAGGQPSRRLGRVRRAGGAWRGRCVAFRRTRAHEHARCVASATSSFLPLSTPQARTCTR